MEQMELLSESESMSVDLQICSGSESLKSWSPDESGSESLPASDMPDIDVDQANATPVANFGSGMAGVGCAEQAVERVHKAFQELLLCKFTTRAVAKRSTLQFVSACDLSRACQNLLMGRSEHVFGDIRDAFPTLEMLGPDRPVAERWALAKRAAANVPRICRCHVACRPPPVTVDISGSPCQPWSRAGQKRRWTDGRSDLLLLWAALMLKQEPPVILHENVSGFPTSVLEDLMQEKYVIHHLRVEPHHVGFTCVNRPRVYSVLVHRSRASVADIPTVYHFVTSFFNSVGGGLSIRDCYIGSVEETLEEENFCRRAKGLDMVQTPSRSWECLLTGQQQKYLAKYRETWQQCRSDKEQEPVFDLSQNPARFLKMTTKDGRLPTFRTNTKIWVDGLSRWLLPVEMAAAMAMNYGVLGQPNRQQVGNGMHVANCGVMLAVALAFTR
ncbi:unnamed protein product [Symbiodinium sp. CCMP2592]|nr:unnamed protein product [Symbiodinium sp. CCMP2592]